MRVGFLAASVLALTAVSAPAFAAPKAGAKPARLDLSKPEDALAASRKMQCSLKDGEPVVYQWTGKVYSRVPGEPDRHLYNIEGMNVRACATVEDPVRGKGFRQVSRELMVYTDPKTNEVLRTWTNPWTGKSVEVLHVANDPVNFRAPIFPKEANGAPYRFPGRVEFGRVFMPIEVPLFYRNPLAGDYQDQVGNQYHAMEIFDFMAEESDLLDASRNTAKPAVAWVRIAPWLPFMEMGGRPGFMVFNATGQVVPGIDALPAVLRNEIAANFPIYREPPPLNDARPNETSWTYYKKYIDAKRAAAPAPAPRR